MDEDGWDQIRILTAENQRISTQLELLQTKLKAGDEHEDASANPPLSVQPIAPLLPLVASSGISNKLLQAGVALIIGYVCCVVQDDIGALDGIYIYLQLVSTIGAGPVDAPQRGLSILVCALALLAYINVLRAIVALLIERRAAAMFQLLSTNGAPNSAWANWESLEVSCLPLVWLISGLFSASFPLILSCEDGWNALDALYLVGMCLCGTGLSDNSSSGPHSTGAKVTVMLLAVGCVVVFFHAVIVLLDTALAAFAIRVLQITAKTAHQPIDAKVFPAIRIYNGKEPAQQHAVADVALAAQVAEQPHIQSNRLPDGQNSPIQILHSPHDADHDNTEIESDHEECTWSPGSKTGQQGRDLMSAKRGRPQHSRELGTAQYMGVALLAVDAPEARKPQQPTQEKIQAAFLDISGGTLVMGGELVSLLCDRLGIHYSESKHQKLLARLDSHATGEVEFATFYRWMVKRNRKKYRRHATDSKQDESGGEFIDLGKAAMLSC